MKYKGVIKSVSCLLISLICILSISIAQAPAESFEEYKKNQERALKEKGPYSEREDFKQYKNELEKEFEQYKKIVEREFEKYTQKILEKWTKAEISTKKRWVEYSSDYHTRRAVDFEEGFIKLDIITDKTAAEEEVNSSLNEIFSDLVKEDQKTAYERNQLAQNIEEQLSKSDTNVKTDQVPAKSILTRVLTGKENPSKKEVRKAVSRLKAKAEITSKGSKIKGKKVIRAKTPLPPDSLMKKAEEYSTEVNEYASERGLAPSLVYAIIHTESAFNPMARSYVPAYGLMQIVPQSAGKDASKLLFGEPRLLSPSYLYNGEKNINIGTCYLYLLYNKYLKKIKSPESRIYCSIAAYNTGPGNVAKAFTGTTNIDNAAALINKMSPKEVYQHLMKKLPYEETRDYLENVTKRTQIYSEI